MSKPNEIPSEWSPYEDEIDLRQYVLLLLRFWYWPVGAAVLAALAAALVSLFVLTPTYEATALATVAQPIYVVRLDPETGEPRAEIAQKSLPQLAMSDDVLQAVLARVPAPWPDFTLAQLKGSVSAKSGSDPGLVELRVSSPDPAWAAQAANAWAELFVEHANRIYGESTQQVTALEQQLADAAARRETAEQALVEFQGRNELSVLNARLGDVRQAYNQRLARRRQLAIIAKDVQGLRDLVAAQPPNAPVYLGDELTGLFLQVQVFNAGGTSIQLQLNPAEVERQRTTGELTRFLDQLLVTIDAKSQALESELEGLNAEILALQQRIQAVEAEKRKLEEQVELARQTYEAVAQKLEEARLATQLPAGTFKVASLAAVPEEPVSPKPLLNTLLAGVLGGMLGVAGVFVAEYLRGLNVQETAMQEQEAGIPQPSEA